MSVRSTGATWWVQSQSQTIVPETKQKQCRLKATLTLPSLAIAQQSGSGTTILREKLHLTVTNKSQLFFRLGIQKTMSFNL